MSFDAIHQWYVALYCIGTGTGHVETVEQHVRNAMYSCLQNIPPTRHVVGIFPEAQSANRYLEVLGKTVRTKESPEQPSSGRPLPFEGD